jgi:Baculovirus protein of unknown function (DUF816)
MEVINVDVFARQLIVDKCSALIESEGMLPEENLAIVKRARDDYFSNPSAKNYEYLKRLFSKTKLIDDGIECKNFNRRMLLIAYKFALNKSKSYFKNYKNILEEALKRLDGINPDLKNSPSAMLQHYNECLENLDNPRAQYEHHLITLTKEIASKIFIETIDLYSYNNKSPFEPSSLKTSNVQQHRTTLMHNTIKNTLIHKKKIKPIGQYKIATPLFSL